MPPLRLTLQCVTTLLGYPKTDLEVGLAGGGRGRGQGVGSEREWGGGKGQKKRQQTQLRAGARERGPQGAKDYGGEDLPVKGIAWDGCQARRACVGPATVEDREPETEAERCAWVHNGLRAAATADPMHPRRNGPRRRGTPTPPRTAHADATAHKVRFSTAWPPGRTAPNRQPPTPNRQPPRVPTCPSSCHSPTPAATPAT